MTQNLVMISTEFSHQLGLGHLKRSIDLFHILKSRGILAHILIRAKKPIAWSSLNEIPHTYVKSAKDEKRKILDLKKKGCLFLFIDRQNRASSFYQHLDLYKIGLDHRSEMSPYLDFHHASIPHQEVESANISSPLFFLFSPQIYAWKKYLLTYEIRKVLVSFGGSDPQDLSYLVFLMLENISSLKTIRIVLGPLYKGKLLAKHHLYRSHSRIQILSASASLYPYIQEADLVITSFGITALEASAIGSYVYLINQTKEHQDLAHIAQFATAPHSGSLQKDSTHFMENREALIQFLKNPSRSFHIPLEENKKWVSYYLDYILSLRNQPFYTSTHQKILYRDGLFHLCYDSKKRVFHVQPWAKNIHIPSLLQSQIQKTKEIKKTTSSPVLSIDFMSQMLDLYLSKLLKTQPVLRLESLFMNPKTQEVYDTLLHHILETWKPKVEYHSSLFAKHMQWYPSENFIHLLLAPLLFYRPFEHYTQVLLDRASQILVKGGYFIYLIPSFTGSPLTHSGKEYYEYLQATEQNYLWSRKYSRYIWKQLPGKWKWIEYKKLNPVEHFHYVEEDSRLLDSSSIVYHLCILKKISDM